MRLLNEMAARDAVIEMVRGHVDANGAERPWRIRLLDCADGRIVVERPRQAVGGQRLHEGDPVTLIGSHDGTRWLVRTTVEAEQRYRINSRVMVPALRLLMPERVHSAQRRGSYRVNCAGLDVPPVQLSAAGEGKVVKSRLQRVSAGGIDVLLTRVPEGWDTGTFLEVGMYLPLVEADIDCIGRLTHITRRNEGDYRLGMAFTFATEAEREATEQVLLRFSAAVQRQQLRRQRLLRR